HSRLAQLQQLRQHSRDTITTCQTQASALTGKIQTNSFTTSAATDAEYARCNTALAQQKADVAKKITDWPAAAQAADALTAAFTAVDRAIDSQKSEHESAVQKVSALSSAVSDAQAYVNDSDTRQPARNKLAQAKQALSEVQTSMQRPKSDWASLGRQ